VSSDAGVMVLSDNSVMEFGIFGDVDPISEKD
jgi:hypothetical protein